MVDFFFLPVPELGPTLVLRSVQLPNPLDCPAVNIVCSVKHIEPLKLFVYFIFIAKMKNTKKKNKKLEASIYLHSR